MKYLISLFVATSLLFGGGCATPEKAAYSTTVIAADAVSTAVDLWNAYVLSGKATQAQEDSVAKSFNAYQAALGIEADVVASQSTNLTADTLTQVNAAVAATRVDLLNLIASFVPHK